MGILDRLRARLDRHGGGVGPGEPPGGPSGAPGASITADFLVPACLELAGTTTNSAGAAQAVFHGAGYPHGGLLYRDGQLVAEPDNAVDPHAVAVHVAGERVGYLPGFAARMLPLDRAWSGAAVPVQLWAAEQPAGLRVRAFAWLGGGEPRWDYDAASPAPVTVEEKVTEEATRRARLREERLAGGGEEARAERSGLVRGKHFTEWPDTVRALKREGRNHEALALLYELVEATEQDARGRGQNAPAPWYTEQAAVVHRKLKDFAGEVAVLERYCAFSPTAAQTFAERLDKARKMHARASTG